MRTEKEIRKFGLYCAVVPIQCSDCSEDPEKCGNLARDLHPDDFPPLSELGPATEPCESRW